MKIVRNVVFRDNKKIPIIMIGIAFLMLLITLCNVSFNFAADKIVDIQVGGLLSATILLIPLTWCLAIFMLMRLKKPFFAKLPAYVVTALTLIAMVAYFFLNAENGDTVTNILVFAIAIFIIYPFIIVTLTIEGRMYNKVFANLFSAILLIVSLLAAIVLFVVLKSIVLSYLIPAMVYTELILLTCCFDLEKIKKNKD